MSGWGRNDFSYGANQAVQRFVDVPIVNRTQCQATLKLTRLGKNFELDPGFMCAGGEPGKDACTGDGGAPLVCKVVSQWYVVGLVNWGIGKLLCEFRKQNLNGKTLRLWNKHSRGLH